MNRIFFSSEEKTWGQSWKCRLQDMRKSHNLRRSVPSKVLGSQTFTFSGLDSEQGWHKVHIPAARSDITCKNLSPGSLSLGDLLWGHQVHHHHHHLPDQDQAGLVGFPDFLRRNPMVLVLYHLICSQSLPRLCGMCMVFALCGC